MKNRRCPDEESRNVCSSKPSKFSGVFALSGTPHCTESTPGWSLQLIIATIDYWKWSIGAVLLVVLIFGKARGTKFESSKFGKQSPARQLSLEWLLNEKSAKFASSIKIIRHSYRNHYSASPWWRSVAQSSLSAGSWCSLGRPPFGEKHPVSQRF